MKPDRKDYEMKKIALALVLAAVSGAAMAEWVEIDRDDDNSHHVDPATIRRSGSMVKMWTLLDYKTIQSLAPGVSMLSMKTQDEYDCSEVRSRKLYATLYSGKMGGGTVIATSNVTDEWRPISPQTIRENLWKFACGKK